jgi:N-acetylneuraminic acid mutarotase
MFIKKIVSLFLIFFVPTISHSQNFTWIKGDSAAQVLGVYGTQGVPHPNNKPGARSTSATFAPSNGNLWLFGGGGWSSSSTSGFLNDMWKFDTLTKNWTWMKGSNVTDALPFYGTKGVSAANNDPGARRWPSGWVDAAGDFWIYGGFINNGIGFGLLNDLWKYKISNNQWTWMGGVSTTNQKSSFGIQGVFSTTSYPSSRENCVTWTDNSGKLWLFGGFGFDSTGTQGVLDDLWQYDPSINQWAWMKGSKIVNQTGTFSPIGVTSFSNNPAARYYSSGFKDATGNLWLFGGFTKTSIAYASMNDLWKYDISTNSWTWMKGSVTGNQNGIYGTLGVPSASNCPGSRYSMASWLDKFGNFWIFGGNGMPATSYGGKLNDVWKFDLSSLQWTWMKGTNLIDKYGVYGTKNISATTNLPGGRLNPLSWTNHKGDFYLMAGFGYATKGINNDLNDLWKYDDCFIPTQPQSANNQVICDGASVQLNVSSNGSIIWYSNLTSTTSIAFGSSFSTPTLSTGTYTYYAESASSCAVNGTRTAVIITVNTLPVVSASSSSSIICTGETATLTAIGANTYSWTTGNTSTIIVVSPSVTTNYSVVGTDANLCSNSSTLSLIVDPCIGINELHDYLNNISIYPNPTSDVISIQIGEDAKENLKVELHDISGKIIRTNSISTGQSNTFLNLRNISAGIYFIKISNGNNNTTRKIVVTKD